MVLVVKTAAPARHFGPEMYDIVAAARSIALVIDISL